MSIAPVSVPGPEPRRPRPHEAPPATDRRLAALSLAALGVVYGDIGTSPLYAFREAFNPGYWLPVTPAVVHGVLSLIVWALILVVSVKYIALIMRADNRGEGGILALLALIGQTRRSARLRPAPAWWASASSAPPCSGVPLTVLAREIAKIND